MGQALGLTTRMSGIRLAILALLMPILSTFTALARDDAGSQPAPLPEAHHPQGVWGSEEACEDWRADKPPRPESTVYEIGPQWINRGMFYCFIGGSPATRTHDGRHILSARCGEDGRAIGYHLTLETDADNALTVIWNPKGTHDHFRFGPFGDCRPGPGS